MYADDAYLPTPEVPMPLLLCTQPRSLTEGGVLVASMDKIFLILLVLNSCFQGVSVPRPSTIHRCTACKPNTKVDTNGSRDLG